ncbi:TIGR04282 family arsenosugar biosynthesis glycosyltransferase [Croceivirga thetidis]|uniref:DUF2064 domain-containing protein n=1 Tax=Croceivirga thetidis TaxID=2721623 RepID=A0ABX1GQ27_9FLAO|nr:DUF2064 domain-containing protein [Croceivirga thetidis]NKI31180.1 DUF2064 domain-containing protein [Croceivirga thetidis]
MKSSPKNTVAILVFANSSLLDESRKGIPHSRQLFDELTDDVLKKVEKTGLPFYLCDERQQIGSDFGTRFTAAIQTTFAKGFDSIITVGNDTPHLTVEMLLQSHKNLMEGKTVIGPSSDGGVYLLGIHKNKFDAQLFRVMPWQQETLFDTLGLHFLRKGILHQLPKLNDLDSTKDIQIILDTKQRLSVALTGLLLRLVRKSRAERTPYLVQTISGFQNPNFNKGSPLHFQ